MKTLGLIIGAMAALTAVGCGDDDRPGGRVDSGGIRIMDGGPSGTDSGPPRTDAGGGTCPPVMVPGPEMAACQMSTVTCITMAMDEAAFNACLAADPMGDACVDCLDQGLVSCGTMRGGCAQSAGDLECCAQAMCPGMSGPALQTCVQSMCGPEGMAFNDCVVAAIRAGTCGIDPVCVISGGGTFLPELTSAPVDSGRLATLMAARAAAARALLER